MKGRTLLIALAAFVVIGVIVAAVIPKGSATQTTTNQQTITTQGTLAPVQNGVQEVTLSLRGGNYVVTPSTLKAGVPVKMTVDLSTVSGCTKSIVIPAMGVRQTVSPGNNVITFTPVQTGTIKMSCSMGMAQGSFQVVADGSVETTVQAGQEGQAQQAPLQPTVQQPMMAGCGMKPAGGGGGCGCGG